MPKYPNIKVQLSGEDGNVFFILGRMQSALRKGNVPAEEIKAFMTKAMSGDYDNALRTCMEWVEVS